MNAEFVHSLIKQGEGINVRNLIFREVIANTLIHREYTNPYPAKLIIAAGMVHTENANKAHGMEQLTPQRFTPYPKNPVIARVFKEIGRADELGSGVRNIFEHYKHYSEQKPRLEENDVFNCFVYTDKSLDNVNVTENVIEKVVEKVVENRRQNILRIIDQNNKITTEEIAKLVGVVRRTIARDIDFLKAKGVLFRVGSDKTGHWEIVKNLD